MSHLLVCTLARWVTSTFEPRASLTSESDCKRLLIGHGSKAEVSTGSELWTSVEGWTYSYQHTMNIDMSPPMRANGACMVVTPANIPAADLKEPFQNHTILALRWWLQCRGCIVPSSWKESQIISRCWIYTLLSWPIVIQSPTLLCMFYVLLCMFLHCVLWNWTNDIWGKGN